MTNESLDVTYCNSDDCYVVFYKPTWQWARGRFPREAIENLYKKVRREGIGRFPLQSKRRVGSTAWQRGDVNR